MCSLSLVEGFDCLKLQVLLLLVEALFICSLSMFAAERELTAAGAGAGASELQMRELLLASRVLQRAIRACLSLDAAFLAHLLASSRTRTLSRAPALRTCCSSASARTALSSSDAHQTQTQTRTQTRSTSHCPPQRPPCPLCPTFSAAAISGAGARGRSGCGSTQAAAEQQQHQHDPRASLRAHYAQVDAAFAAVGRELLARTGAVE